MLLTTRNVISRQVAAALLLMSLPPVMRGAAGKRFYQLSAGDAAKTLHQFIEQSGEQIIYFIPKIRGVTTNAVRGKFTAMEAIELMTANTDIRVVQDKKTGAFTVGRPARAPSHPSPPPDSKKK